MPVALPYTDPALMTMAQVQAEFVELGNDISVIDGRRRQLLNVMDRRRDRARAKAAVNTMTPDERAALKTELEQP